MRSFRSVLPAPLALLFSLLLFLFYLPRPAVQAAGTASPEHVQILAHLPLTGMHVNQMFLQQRDNKFYLYLHRPGKNAFAVVDVTQPGKPELLSRGTLQEPPRAQVNPPAPGSLLAIAVRPESAGQSHLASARTRSSEPELATETVQLVDLSDPRNPKTLKTFQGVTSMYPDDARKLVYLADNEGLWIVQHRAVRPLPVCNSEDALNPLPQCQ